MITEKDLREAIAECEGSRNPSANTCIKLAAYYTILENLYGNQNNEVKLPEYSFKSSETQYSDSEFSDLVRIKGIDRVFPILDETMSTLYVLNPKLYNSVLNKIAEL